MSFAPLQRPKTSGQDVDRGRGGATQARRYWPGKAPDWVPPNSVAEASDEEEEAVDRTSVAAPVIVKAKDDPRLARLADKGDSRDRAARRREIAAPRVVSRRQREETSDEESSEEESDKEIDEEAVEARRAAVRERLKQNKQPEEEVLAQQEDVSDEEEDETEYETDSEDEGYGQQLLKPMFVSKSERETIAERERLFKEAEEEKEREKQRREVRAAETRVILNERILLDEAQARAAQAETRQGEGDINTDDDDDDTAEYEQWHHREMARIARYKEDQQREVLEAAEKAKLASMTDEERRRWELENPKESQIQPKEKWRFLQKYWHKGAFFQETSDNPYSRDQVDEVYARDYSAPTGEDKLDKSVLPKVMQVKNFGRRGRTKHTHLVDQDTTVFDDDLAPERALQDAYFKRVAGVSQTFVKPKTLPINEKRHITGKDKRIAEAGSSRAAYPKNNY
ncbi:hypothetical protein ABBQ38_002090 [Trebouxia sp. C0009 RCD-2024]